MEISLIFRECLTKLCNSRGIDAAYLSADGSQCFTFNKEDECFVQWNVDPLVLEEAIEDHKPSIDDFLLNIPGGKDSKLYTDIKDIFCYVQIEKGVTALSTSVPIEDIPTMCRALGFYTTEKEIEDMMNEVDFVHSNCDIQHLML